MRLGNIPRSICSRAMASMCIPGVSAISRLSIPSGKSIVPSRAVVGLSGSARPAVGQRLTRRAIINNGLQYDLDNRSVAA